MRYEQLSDVQLVTSYKKGSEEAFAVLVNRHQTKIYSSIYFMVKDKFIAEDILQEVFMKVVHHIKSGKYNEEGKFLPWTLRIAYNLTIDFFRKQKRAPIITLNDGSPLFNSLEFSDANIENNRISREAFSSIKQMIKELPIEQRRVVIMRHFLGMSFSEIAERTGVSINTALGRMRYALINLRKRLTSKQFSYDKNFYPE